MKNDNKRSFTGRSTIICILVLAVLMGAWVYRSIASPSCGTIEECISCFESKEYEIACGICTGLADEGNALAKVVLGRLYEDGLFVQKDYDMAEKLFAEAAHDTSDQKAQRIAQFCLGDLYERNDFPRHSLKISASCYRSSAESGFNRAQLHYGVLLFLGYGTEENTELAKEYLERASRNGMQSADKILALMNGRNADKTMVLIHEQLNNRKFDGLL